MPWIVRNRARIDRTVELYGQLGYASVEFVLRPGEEKFVQLADCILPRGYILSVDYGASFDALAHSTAGVSGTDGVVTSLMPVPDGFPDCHTEWMKCPGLVDWTSFVDFTNMADAGEELGWKRDFYGPQNALEQIANTTVISRGTRVLVPGYFVLEHASLAERHVVGWYGKEMAEHQRWTGFKVLIQQKGAPPHQLVAQPSWHLDVTELDPCVSMDFADLPVADTLWRNLVKGIEPRTVLIGQTDASNEAMNTFAKTQYDRVQMAVRLVDWLVATRGCTDAPVQSWGQWLDLWGADGSVALFERILRARRGLDQPEPFECFAHRAWRLLC